MPATLHQRYVTLNQTYANAWRVTNASSLFDYAPGTSTATFTFTGWPGESGDCKVPTQPPPAEPIDPRKAEEICGQVADRARHANCVFDVAVTGRPEFAKAYLLTERIHTGATVIRLTDNWGPINEQLTKPLPYLIAKVSRLVAGGRAPVGAVEFTLDGRQVAEPVPLDEEGIARVKVPDLKPGRHVASAVYIPNKDSVFLRSASPEKILEFGATGR
jgi:hypothetical protein